MQILSSAALEQLAKLNKISLNPSETSKLAQSLNHNLSKLVKIPVSQGSKIPIELRGETIVCFGIENNTSKNDKLLINTQHSLKNQSITIQTSLKAAISS